MLYIAKFIHAVIRINSKSLIKVYSSKRHVFRECLEPLYGAIDLILPNNMHSCCVFIFVGAMLAFKTRFL